jgi:parvulin-like peptidyl-prolyl isomerase
LNEKIAGAIKNVKAGDFAKLESDEGIQIIRVDTRSAASDESVFNENAVRTAMTYEKLPEERKKYMGTLRKEAYIKISDSYRPIVAPILGIDSAKASVSTK